MSKIETVLDTEILKTKRTDKPMVDPRAIKVEEGFNVRRDMGDIEGLAKSVVSEGVIVNLEVYKVHGADRYVLTDGHRRLAAVLLALKYHDEGKEGFQDVSKITRVAVNLGSANMKERLYKMAITGEKKKDLTELERAEMYARLIEFGVAEGHKKGDVVKEIMQKVGVSQATIYNILKLNEFPEEIKSEIASGSISGSTVVALVREVKDEKEQVRIVKEAVAEVKAAATTEGKEAKKATAKNVKSLKAKTPIQKMKDALEKLEKKEVKNTRVTALRELIENLETKGSVADIVTIFS